MPACRVLFVEDEPVTREIMADTLGDAGFDLLEAWERKEQLDAEIGRFIRAATA